MELDAAEDAAGQGNFTTAQSLVTQRNWIVVLVREKALAENAAVVESIISDHLSK